MLLPLAKRLIRPLKCVLDGEMVVDLDKETQKHTRRWEGADSISRFHQGSWAGVRLVVSSGMPLC